MIDFHFYFLQILNRKIMKFYFLVYVLTIGLSACNDSSKNLKSNEEFENVQTDSKQNTTALDEYNANKEPGSDEHQDQTESNYSNSNSKHTKEYYCKWCEDPFGGSGFSVNEQGDIHQGKHAYNDPLMAILMGAGEDEEDNIGDFCSRKCAKEYRDI